MKQLKMSPIIGSGRDTYHNILLTIPNKDCLHSSLGVGLVLGIAVLGPVPGAVPTGPVPGVTPRLATAPTGPLLFMLRKGHYYFD